MVVRSCIGIEFSFLSLKRYIGSVAIGSSSSPERNMGVISTIAFLLKYRCTVIDEKIYWNEATGQVEQ